MNYVARYLSLDRERHGEAEYRNPAIERLSAVRRGGRMLSDHSDWGFGPAG